jgi:hypothetical protein
MAWYLIRVELHDADSDDYDILHQAMKDAGFLTKIDDDNGIWYKLPTAEYYISSALNVDAIWAKATEVAETAEKSFWLIVLLFNQARFTLDKSPQTLKKRNPYK